MEETYKEFYYEHRREIIKEFREMFRINGDSNQLPEDDEDLENWYLDVLLEMAKDWYEQESDEINTRNSNFTYK